MRASRAIAMQQSVVPDYRLELLDYLRERHASQFEVWCGSDYFDPTTRTSSNLPDFVTLVRNRYLFGRRAEWQHRIVRPLISAEVAILEFNPRVTSNWVILLGRRIRGRRTILWGHAWARTGSSRISLRLRAWMRGLSHAVVVYTEQQRAELMASGATRPVVAAPNALYRRKHIRSRDTEVREDVLYSGRLVSSKKPGLLLDGFAIAVAKGLAPDIKLVFAGDGPEREQLEQRIAVSDAGHRIAILGHVPPSDLTARYDRALVSVSPGYVGLSMVQSFSFGVPMLYASNEPHSPEIEAAIEGINAVSFPSDDAGALADALLRVAAERAAWSLAAKDIAEQCREHYSIEHMAERLTEAMYSIR